MDLGRLGARLLIGGLFVGHGLQKLNGSFGGPGIEGTEQMMTALGMHPARRNAYAAGVTETAGGALIALGAATPLAAASLIGVMTTAIRKVHLPNGPWAANGGWEYNAVLIGALAALVETGPGRVSIDNLLGRAPGGSRGALGAVALGVGASYATIALASRADAQQDAVASSDGEVADATGDVAGDPVTSES
ncbi:MAG: DoxX family protein [Actinomycetota bacterium]|nr:DoxX family protein [Actinomycetota bacterium]